MFESLQTWFYVGPIVAHKPPDSDRKWCKWDDISEHDIKKCSAPSIYKNIVCILLGLKIYKKKLSLVTLLKIYIFNNLIGSVRENFAKIQLSNWQFYLPQAIWPWDIWSLALLRGCSENISFSVMLVLFWPSGGPKITQNEKKNVISNYSFQCLSFISRTFEWARIATCIVVRKMGIMS